MKMATICDIKDFPRHRGFGTIVVTSGGFDPLHPGHVSCIIEASNLGDTLVVVVNGDGFLRRKKGAAFMPCEDRCKTVASMRGVDIVIPFEPSDPEDDTVNEALLSLRPDIFAKGGDRRDAASIPEWNVCKANAIRVVMGVGWRKNWSSSDYLEKWEGHYVSRKMRKLCRRLMGK